MSKYDFKYNQRYAVYKAFDGICQWCREPVNFQNFHVDHVLPEELLSDKARLKEVLDAYGLPASFNINDYENWIPAHPYCNQRKSDTVYQGLGIIKTILDSCANRKELEQRIAFRLEREPAKADLLAKVQAAIQQSLVNIQELQNFVLRNDIMDSDDEDFKKIREQLEKSVQYQTEKMVKDMMEILRSHAIDVINNICSSLGIGWRTQWPTLVQGHEEDTQYNVYYFLENTIRPTLTTRISLMPKVHNSQLVVRFREDREVFAEFVQDMNKIDWQSFRNELRRHYKARIFQKMGPKS